MEKNKILSGILIFACILSLPLSFAVVCEVGEVDIFGVGGILRYSWLMLLFVPIEVAALLYGCYLRRKKLKYGALFITALICLFLLLMVGSAGWPDDNSDYSTKSIEKVEGETGIALPNQIKVSTLVFEEYVESRVKITDSGEKQLWEMEIQSNKLWVTSLSTKIKNALPFDIEAEIFNFDYFLFYNETVGAFNQYPQMPGTYKCIFLAYDVELGRFIILSELTLLDS